MITIENVVTPSPEQMQAVVYGMRNPMNSWDRSDSEIIRIEDPDTLESAGYSFQIGEADEELMRKLASQGGPHAKFRRMMPVMMTITAPLYWWKEFDTYQTGVAPNPTDIVKNSCSTMHKIHDKEFALEDFSCEKLSCFDIGQGVGAPITLMQRIIRMLNECRMLYLSTKDKDYWWQMIQLLPSSYNQKRTVALNYEVLARIYRDRWNHKLDEWRDLCCLLERLPYSRILTGDPLPEKPD